MLTNSGTTFTVPAQISGAGRLTKTGTGALTLGGGTLATGGLTPAATLGTLTLSGASTIDFGSGTSAVAFADSPGAGWNGTLTIANYTSGTDTLRFGTSSSGLTSTQLALTDFGSGYTTQIDSLGYVTGVGAIPEPSTYAALFGAAALGLAFWRPRESAKRQTSVGAR